MISPRFSGGADMTRSADTISRIRELNDALLTTFTGGRVLMTAGVAALPEALTAEVLQRVRSFDKFDRDNDPHGEHDFGTFDIEDETFFWKIDHNRDLDGGSAIPAASPERANSSSRKRSTSSPSEFAG
jgi:Protein of unknown function (DUF3768)